MESFTLEQLAKLIGGTPLGSFHQKISHLQDSRACDNSSVCYVKEKKFIDTLSQDAGAVITEETAFFILHSKVFLNLLC